MTHEQTMLFPKPSLHAHTTPSSTCQSGDFLSTPPRWPPIVGVLCNPKPCIALVGQQCCSSTVDSSGGISISSIIRISISSPTLLPQVLDKPVFVLEIHLTSEIQTHLTMYQAPVSISSTRCAFGECCDAMLLFHSDLSQVVHPHASHIM